MHHACRTALITPFLAVLAATATLAAALLPATAQAAEQGSGRAATEARTLAEFQAVWTSGNIDLVVRQGAQSVQVQADDNLLPVLETVVEKDGLLVRWKRGTSVHTRTKALVTVSLPRLHTLGSAGAGDIKLERYATPALQLSLAGSGDAKLDALQADELNVSISGSSDIAGSGRATKLKLSIAGSGDARLAGMQADEVAIRIAGSGHAAVNAQKSLDVSIAGSGDVSYSGNAALKSTVAGSGSVRKQ